MSGAQKSVSWPSVCFFAFLALCVIALGAVEYEALLRAHRFRPYWAWDFRYAYWVESKMMALRDFHVIYFPGPGGEWQVKHGLEPVFPGLAYPPLMGLFFLPLTHLDAWAAANVWAVANQIVTFALGLGLGYWMVGPRPWLSRLTVSLVTAVAFSLSAMNQVNLVQGQTGSLITAFCALACIAYYRNYRRLTAAALALAISLKAYPAVLALPLLARRDWKTLAYLALAMLAWNGVAAVYIGKDTLSLYADWLYHILPEMSDTPPEMFTDQSLRAVGLRWAGPGGQMLGKLLSAVLVVVSLWACRRADSRRRVALALALACLVTCLAPGRSWHMYHSLVWLAAALYCRSQPHLDTLGLKLFALLLLPMALLDSDLAVKFFYFRCWLLMVGLHCFLMLGMWALCLYELTTAEPAGLAAQGEATAAGAAG